MPRVDLPPGIIAMRAHRNQISIDLDVPLIDITAAIQDLASVRDVMNVTFKTTTILVEHSLEHSSERVKYWLIRALRAHLDATTSEAITLTNRQSVCVSCAAGAHTSGENSEITLEEALGEINSILPADLEIVIRKKA